MTTTTTTNVTTRRQAEILSAGVRAIRTYLSTTSPLGPRSTPEHEVLEVLVSSRIDDWGETLPHGLSIPELAAATRFNHEDVLGGIAALRNRSVDKPGWRIVETEVEGFRRFSVLFDEVPQ